MAVISSGQITLTDLNDSKQLILYLNANYKTQLYNPNGPSYNPNFTSSNLVITPELYVAGGNGANLLPSTQIQSLAWYEGSQTTTALAETATTGTTGAGYTYNIPTGAVGTTAKPLTIKSNLVSNAQKYTCVIVYRDVDTGFDITIKADVEIAQITNGVNAVDALSVVMSNENATVPTDKNGANGVYTATGTNVYLYEGTTALTYDGAGTTNGTWKMTASGSGITAGAVSDGGVFGTLANASAITQDAATITVTITGKRQDGTAISLTKTQTITRVKSGQDPTSYWMVVDASAVQKAASGTYTPATINISGKSQVGAGTPGAYVGNFTVEEDTGSGYVNKYTTAVLTTGESSKAYAVATAGIKSIRIRLYALGAITNLLDEQVIPVVVDGTQSVIATLSNEATTIATDQAGANGVYTNSGTDIHVYDGATELTYDNVGTTNGTWKVTAAASGITAGTVSDSGLYATYGVASAISADNASITYTITGKSLSGQAFTLTKIQSFSRAKTGVAPTAYWLTVSAPVIQKNVAGTFNPTTLTITGFSQTGGGTPSSTAIFKFRTDVDSGSGFVNGTATGALASTTYSSFPAGLKAVRFRLYQSSVTPSDTNFIDEVIVNVVSDGATGVDAFYLNVWCPKGDTIRNSAGTIDIQADLYKGSVAATGTITYQWYIQDPSSTAAGANGGDADGGDGWRKLDATTNYGVLNYTTAKITVPASAIAGVEGFKCVAKLNSNPYKGVTIVRDFQDPVSVNILGTNIFKNGQGNVVLNVQLIQAGAEISTAGYTFAWALYNTAGGLIKTYAETSDTITVPATDVTGTANLVVDVSK